MNIKDRITALKEEIPPNCTLVAVSKTKPVSDILMAYEAGHLDFGENKVQELTQKADTMPKDIRWHMIGHLQRNKVKYIVPFVHLIHGVDSSRLLSEIDKQGGKIGRVIDCLLQVDISNEETKFGFDQEELVELLRTGLKDMKWVQVRGLMGMASNTTDMDRVRAEFRSLKNLIEKLKKENFHERVSMEILSMGMSGDYQVAIEEGSNLVRVGSLIFGERNYA